MKHETNKNPKGKLYAKFYNSMRALKTSGLIPSNAQVKVPVKSLIRKDCIHFGKNFKMLLYHCNFIHCF